MVAFFFFRVPVQRLRNRNRGTLTVQAILGSLDAFIL